MVSAAINNRVLFDADGNTVDEGWSVIVKGTARSPRTDEELEEGQAGMVISLDSNAKAPSCPHPPAEYHGAAIRIPAQRLDATRPGRSASWWEQAHSLSYQPTIFNLGGVGS